MTPGGVGGSALTWRLRVGFWGLACVLGALQAWAYRNYINPDGISYLDIGDAYFRGDWTGAINLTWSPLYSLLMGAAMRLVRPSVEWEFPLVHVVNLAVFLAALASFEFFLRALPRRLGQDPQSPAWSHVGWGYALFLTATLGLTNLATVTPDMLVVATAFLVAGMLLRFADGVVRLRWFVGFGAVLALGYLAKTVMFAVALASFALAGAAIGDLRRSLPRVLAAVGVFALVTGPFIGVLSVTAGRFTVGEAGRLAYVFAVNREYQPPMFRFESARPLSWLPLHPPQKVLDEPAVYEFGSSVPGTFPLWYDPWHWHRDVRVQLHLDRQIAAIRDALGDYWRILIRMAPLMLGLFGLVALTGRRWFREIRARRVSVLSAWAGTPLVLYALIHVEPRYVSGFLAILSLGFLSAVRVSDRGVVRRAAAAISICAVILQVLWVGRSVIYEVAHEVKAIIINDETANRHSNAARALRDLGIRPGDRVAVAGGYFKAGWARLARVRIVAVVDDPAGLTCWVSVPSCRERLAATLAATGAVILVVENPPARVVGTSEWRRLGVTQFYAYSLR